MVNLPQAIVVGALSIVCCTTGFAADGGWALNASSIQSVPKSQIIANSNFYKRLSMPFVDAVQPGVTLTVNELNSAQKLQAKTWGLTNKEEARFVLLMKGKDNIYYKDSGLTPVQILGINAKSNERRDYYAGLASLQRAQRTAKEEAFFSAYGKAYAHLMKSLKLPAVRPFNIKPFSPLNNTKLNVRKGDEVLLFVNGAQAVSPMVTQALFAVMQTPDTHLNIYFEGKGDTKPSIEAWANHQSIPKRLVQKGVITLNRNSADWSALSKNYALPALFIVRDGKTIALNVKRAHD